MTAQATESVVPLGRAGRPRPLRAFRVRPASTLKDEHEQVLALVGQNFCRLFGADLSTFVGSEVDIDMGPVQQWSWDDLLSALPEPYCAARLAMPPMAGTGLMSLDMALSTAVVEKLLGGAGQPLERDQPLTEVEVTLLGELHQRGAEDLAEALSLVVGTRPVTSRQESRLELIRAAPGRTLLVALDFEVDMKSVSGHMRVAVPTEALLARLQAFAGPRPPRPRWPTQARWRPARSKRRSVSTTRPWARAGSSSCRQATSPPSPTGPTARSRSMWARSPSWRSWQAGAAATRRSLSSAPTPRTGRTRRGLLSTDAGERGKTVRGHQDNSRSRGQRLLS